MMVANIEVCPIDGSFGPHRASAASAWGGWDLPVGDSVIVKSRPTPRGRLG